MRAWNLHDVSDGEREVILPSPKSLYAKAFEARQGEGQGVRSSAAQAASFGPEEQ